jgi:hypothetical protein
MDRISEFVARCDAYAAERGWKRSTLSTALFRDGDEFMKLPRGAAYIDVDGRVKTKRN